jgi:TonB family protein
MTRKIFATVGCLSVALICGLRADFFIEGSVPGEIKVRVLEGQREGAAEPAKAVTASFVASMMTVGYLSDTALDREQEQIRKTFNLKSVRLLTEVDLAWGEQGSGKASHTFRLDGSEYIVKLSAGDRKSGQPLGIEVYEKTSAGEKNLLDTGFGLLKSANRPIVFGFENGQGTPFFVCLHAEPSREEKAGFSIGTEKEKRLEEFAKGAVPCQDDIQPPRLVKMTEPVYPKIAYQKKIEGVVILSAKINEAGKVIDAMVLRSVPFLDTAAMEALKQWEYEPLIINGKPVKAIFTVTVRFSLKS